MIIKYAGVIKRETLKSQNLFRNLPPALRFCQENAERNMHKFVRFSLSNSRRYFLIQAILSNQIVFSS